MARDTLEDLTAPDPGTGLWPGAETVRRSCLLGLEIGFVLGIVFSLGSLIGRWNARFDLTPNQKYSLAPITVQTLDSITFPVQATIFYRRGDREKHDELLSLMHQANALFQYRLYDLDRAPGLAQRYGVTAYGTVILESADNRVTLPMVDEERLLNALLRVSQSQKSVYFLVGHGENNPGDSQERNGYGVVRQVLETENYQVRPLALLQARQVPSDANLVIVSGPKEDLAPAELAALTTYLDAGGNALLMLDPFTVPRLSAYLARFGLRLAEDVVIDEERGVAGGEPLMPIISDFAEDIFPRRLSGSPILPYTRPVRVQDGQATPFAFSSEGSWALKNRARAEQEGLYFKEGEDERGPIPVAAVAAVGTERSGKLVVLGDSDFVNNFYARIPGNVDFFMNTVGWMLGRQQLISMGRNPGGIPDQKRVSTPRQSLYLSELQKRRFFWLMVVLEPALVLAIGLCIAVQRRRRG